MLMSRADQSFPAHLRASLVLGSSPLRLLPVRVAYDPRWLVPSGEALAPSAGNGVFGYQEPADSFEALATAKLQLGGPAPDRRDRRPVRAPLREQLERPLIRLAEIDQQIRLLLTGRPLGQQQDK